MTIPAPQPDRPAPQPNRSRRQPSAFRQVTVRGAEWLSPRMIRVRFAGPELAGFSVEQPAASVRVLLPSPGATELAIPSWNGNEFLLAGGQRPTLRTFTPRGAPGDPPGSIRPELVIDIVVHERGTASQWARHAVVGAPAAVSGPGRGYLVDQRAPGFFLAGDETAIPAIRQLLEVLPEEVPAQVHIELADPDARLALAPHEGRLHWHDLPAGHPPGDALAAAVTQATWPAGTKIWVAGEAASVQRIRRHLFEERGVPRSDATVRGYWKHGRSGESTDEA